MMTSKYGNFMLSDEFILMMMNEYVDVGNIILKFIIQNYRLRPYSRLVDYNVRIPLREIIEEIGDMYVINGETISVYPKDNEVTMYVLSLFNVPIVSIENNVINLLNNEVAFD